MIILESDNRSLTAASKYSGLVTNYPSGISTFYVVNATDSDFAVNAFILISTFGSEDAEILQIQSVDNTGGQITTTTPTKFAHPESSKVSIIPYNKARFFHTNTATFDILTPLTGFIDLQPSDWFTTYSDGSFSSGYGWYAFYNTETIVYSQPSNPIPYIGFDTNTVENIIADFFSLLNNKDLKLVTREDALSWASEGYARMRNKLNLTNVEYTASALQQLTVVPGQIEYQLPADFDHLLFFVSGMDPNNPGAYSDIKIDIEFIPLRLAYDYNGIGPRYYIRGFNIGILPTPEYSTIYNYMYLKKAARLNLNSDVADMPNGGEYVIKDYMMYRAFQKFQNPQAAGFMQAFTAGLNDLVISAVKRDANLDAFGITREANV
jgi:hypothetical protein